MLCVIGWSRGGRYSGSGMDGLRERMGSCGMCATWVLIANAEDSVHTGVFGM